MGSRWADVCKLTTRTGPLANEGNYGTLFSPPLQFEPMPEILHFIRSMARVLVVGAGGLGCELLKDLALMGFGTIDVIDMDTIDISNLNRQFLFRKADVGRPKATVAAEFVMSRVEGVTVTPHYCPIQDKGPDWYRQFQVIIMGLDSIEARRWLNAMACSLVQYATNEGGQPVAELETVIPLVDGGTEGFQGHVRTMYPCRTACFECTLDLFPPQQAVPLCTIAETPRTAAHCILYAHLIEFPREFPEEKPDKDDPAYQSWVYTHALKRAKQFDIVGVTLMHTQVRAPRVHNSRPAHRPASCCQPLPLSAEGKPKLPAGAVSDAGRNQEHHPSNCIDERDRGGSVRERGVQDCHQLRRVPRQQPHVHGRTGVVRAHVQV